MSKTDREGCGAMQNNPLHIQPIQEGATNPLKYDFLTFVGLDAVDSILLEQRERSESILLHSWMNVMFQCLSACSYICGGSYRLWQ